MKFINLVLRILKCIFLLAAIYGFSLFFSDLALLVILGADAFTQLNLDPTGLGFASSRMLPVEFDLFNIFNLDKTLFYPSYISIFLTIISFVIPTKNTVDIWKGFFISHLNNEA